MSKSIILISLLPAFGAASLTLQTVTWAQVTTGEIQQIQDQSLADAACDVCFACRMVQVCLAYSQRHPSTAADELATAALNLLALAVLAGTEGCEAPDVALIQSMVQAGPGSEAWLGSSLLDQLKANRQPPCSALFCGCWLIKQSR